jgi:hypothetical protein
MHGLGEMTWPGGNHFRGEMKYAQKWCGVESTTSSEFYVFRDGIGEVGQSGVDWATVGITIVVIGAVAVVADAAANGGGGGYQPVADIDWDWDQFYDQYYSLQWRCRGIQTGQFAEDEKCLYDLKNDDRWPAK